MNIAAMPILALSAVLLAWGPAQAQGQSLGCPRADGLSYFPLIELKAGFAPDPFTHENEWIRGTTDIHECGFEDTGFVDQRPDYELHWEGEARQLVITMESDADTLLLIHDPNDRWLFNDNGQDQNPMVIIENPSPGSYAIFVGTTVPSNTYHGLLRISQAGP